MPWCGASLPRIPEQASGQPALSAPGGRELRIACAIAEVVRAEAARLAGARALRVGLTIGADCGIEPAAVVESFRSLSQGTELQDVELDLLIRARWFACRDCGRRALDTDRLNRCASCASADYELVQGDELEIAFIEIESV